LTEKSDSAQVAGLRPDALQPEYSKDAGETAATVLAANPDATPVHCTRTDEQTKARFL